MGKFQMKTIALATLIAAYVLLLPVPATACEECVEIVYNRFPPLIWFSCEPSNPPDGYIDCTGGFTCDVEYACDPYGSGFWWADMEEGEAVEPTRIAQRGENRPCVERDEVPSPSSLDWKVNMAVPAQTSFSL